MTSTGKHAATRRASGHGIPGPVTRALRIFLAAASVTLGLSVLPGSANAYEIATTAPSVSGGTGTSTIQSAGLSVSYSGSGLTSIANSTQLGGRGYVASDYTPGLASATNAVNVLTSATNNCPATGTCSGLGTVKIDFGQPVRNPVLHLAGLGGNTFNEQGGTVTASSQLHDVLTLATSGLTLTKLSGSNLAISGGNTITAINDNTGIACDSLSNGSDTLSPGARAACGSVRVNGTVTSVTFNVSAIFTQTTSGTPPYTNNNVNDSKHNEEGFALLASVPEDFGDAPSSYDQGNAARAVTSDVTLGTSITEDNASVANSSTSPNAGTSATGDSADNGVSLAPLEATATSYSADVAISGASKSGTVCGWVDFNKNGTFDSGERACKTFAAGATSATLSWSGLTGVVSGNTYARFRIGYDATKTGSPVGASDAGEVEDYALTISAGPGFTCETGTVFVAQNVPTQLFTAVQTTSGDVTFQAEGPVSSVAYNAIGYRAADGLIYAMRRENGNKTTMVAIGPGGTVTTVGTVTNLPTFSTADYYNQGTFGDGAYADTFFVRATGGTNQSTSVWAIDINTLTATRIILSQTVPNLSDIVFKDGFIWGMDQNSNMWRIAPDGTTTKFATGLNIDRTFGAQWVYGNGNFGLYANGGEVFQVEVTDPASASPSFTLISQIPGEITDNNDGTACPGPDVDLGIVKTGPASYAPGSQVNYTLTVTNHGPGDSSGSIVTDSLPSGLTGFSTPTSVCSIVSQTLTCAVPPLASGATFTITINATASTSASGPISNTATVLGNEKDPEPDNNTSTWTTQPQPNSCNTLWYVTNTPVGTNNPGTYGKVDPATGTWIPVGNLADQSSAFAIDPTDPNAAYYVGWDAATATPDGRLYRLNLSTGTSTQLNSTALAMFGTNRMAVAPDGTLWTMSSSGHLWSTTPTATGPGAPVDHGLVVTPVNSPGGTLTGGDIAFDGLGNMWIIASDSQLWTVSAAELAGTSPQATFVGDMGTQNFPGLAFTSDGSLYASGLGSSATLYEVDPATGVTTSVAAGGPANVGDLGSCALPRPELDSTKDVEPSGAVSPGATLTYNIEVTNSGVVAATGVTLIDDIPQFTSYVPGSTTVNGTAIADVNGTFPYAVETEIHSPGSFDGVIAPGETATVTFQVKVDDPWPPTETEVANQGFIKGVGIPEFPTDWPDTPTPDDPVITPVISPAIEVVKSSTVADVDGDGLTDAGDEIAYEFAVTNTGNVTLDGVTVSDPMLAAAGITISCPATSLAPGESMTCTADAAYVITQADVDTGAVSNTATACGTPPVGTATEVCDDGENNVETEEDPAIEVVKSSTVTDIDGDGLTDAGDEIQYSFVVTNTGNVTLSGITVSDPMLAAAGIGITCPATSLTPGASMTCDADEAYVITQADVDAGAVSNTATACGTPPVGTATEVCDKGGNNVETEEDPAIEVVKSSTVTDVDGDGLTDAGDEIAYSFVVTNTGNVTLNNVEVSDPMLAAAGIGISCSQASLAPGESMTCAADEAYVITQADVDAGVVANTATACGTPPVGTATEVCDEGENNVETEEDPAIEVVKSSTVTDADGDGLTDAGDEIQYSFTVTNTGNVTLNNVEVTDPMLAAVGITITCPKSSLAPGESMSCDADEAYVITQADVDTGVVSNVATACGTPLVGTATEVCDDGGNNVETEEDPAIEVVKSSTVTDVDGDGLTDSGDEIDYSFVVTNTGNVTLNNVEVTDPMLTATGIGITCPKSSLASGESMTCAADEPYVITQADVDTGMVANTATVCGTPPVGTATEVCDDGGNAVETEEDPAIEVMKSSTVTDVDGDGLTDAGDEIDYSFAVTNTGNVTLSGITVSDPMLAGAGIGISCPTTSLAAGASMTCTADEPYVITQADVDAGMVANTATACGTPPVGTATEVCDQGGNNVEPEEDPAIEVVKSSTVTDVDGDELTDAGDETQYSFVVTNTGNVTLNNIEVADPMLAAVGITITCPKSSLAPGESMSCDADEPYLITQADADAGGVANVATVCGTPPVGTATEVCDEGENNVETEENPAIEIVKSSTVTDVDGDGLTDAGDEIDYSFVVTNTGNVTLNSVEVSDPMLAAAGIGITCPKSSLAPGESMTCTADEAYVITQADADTGMVANTVIACGTPPVGTATEVCDEGENNVETEEDPAIEVVKSSTVTDVDGDGLTDAGDGINYSFVATNTGNITLNNIEVTDPMLAAAGVGISCPKSSLAPGESMTCTADAAYVITQADVDAGVVANTATACGTPPVGTATEVCDEGENNVEIEEDPAIEVVKSSVVTDVDGDGLTDAGDEIQYSFTVTNAGNVTLNNVSVTDPMLAAAGIGVSCPATSLAPGESMTCDADEPYVITQADVDAGVVSNVATACGTPPVGSATEVCDDGSNNVETEEDPAIEVVKSSVVTDVDGDGLTDAGDEIQYSFTVTNAGNVTLNNVSVTDPMLAAAGIGITCPKRSLAPGESMTCTADEAYVITQADVDTGVVSNVATVCGTPPVGTATEVCNEGENNVETEEDPAIEVVKSSVVTDVDGDGLIDAGDEIAYEFVVTNTGNVTLNNVSVTDPMLAAAGIGITCPKSSLAPGESMTCAADEPYVITQADVDAGVVSNVATACGTPPVGSATEVCDDGSNNVETEEDPAIEIVKSSVVTDVDGDGLTDAGDEIDYSFTVTNTGNITLNNLEVSDPMLAAAGIGITCPKSSLAPGESMTCTADAAYVITQADADAGGVSNVATVCGTPPVGTATEVCDEGGNNVETEEDPAIDVIKSSTVTDIDGDGLTDAGDEIQYSFTVTNTGNITLNNVEVSDPMLTAAGIAITCPKSSLAPGESMTCTADAAYVITQADADAGGVANTATACGTPPVGTATEVCDEGGNNIETEEDPAIDVVKSSTVTDVDGDGLTDAGDEIAYSFVVTNTGNVTLSGITVSDPMLTAAGIGVTCPKSSLAPGESMTCTADEAYVITQADADAGGVDNVATVCGTPPVGTATEVCDEGGNNVETEEDPAIEVVKASTVTDVDGDGLTDAGDEIQYSFVVTNTGNVTLSGITVSDPMLAAAGITITCPQTSLAPGESMTCTADAAYVITQADADGGGVTNVATVCGTPPVGTATEVCDEGGNNVETEEDPAIEVVKSSTVTDVDGDGLTDAGDEIDYSFVVTNTGNVTLSGVSVSDPMLVAAGIGISCPQTSLAPDESMTCIADAAYVITQADVDAGVVANTATACGTPPTGSGNNSSGGGNGGNGNGRRAPTAAGSMTEVCDDGDNSVETDGEPGLALDKRLSTVTDVNGNGRTDLGDELLYEFEVFNTGNVTLTDVKVDDDLLASAGIGVTCPGTTLAPDESMVCEADDPYVISTADVKAGQVVNSAVVVATPPPGTKTPPPGTDTTTTPVDPKDPLPPTSCRVMPNARAATSASCPTGHGHLPDTGMPTGALFAGVGGLLLCLGGAVQIAWVARSRKQSM